ncbi:MAG TPA: D-alanyl-D-alanine carboxypeptidase family protein [Ktedonobacteraceae bacterium]|nr:D-alanyl-D-alanine carboxypeptidase family protein [Ktedonobacteraceae bacterium]
MYKPPLPENDEPYDIPQYSYPARRRKSVHADMPHRRAPEGYRSDEKPGEPKIKRASLLREQQEKKAQLDARRVEAAQPQKLDEREVSRKRTRQAARSEAGKILITPGRRPTSVYIPRVNSRTQESRQPGVQSRRIWSRRGQPRSILSRKQAITGVSLLVVMLVLFIPIALTRHNPASGFTPTTPGADNTQPPAFNEQPAAAHELVILPQDTNHPAPPVFAASAYLLDVDTGNTLYAYHPFQRLPLLSTTKLMTAALAIEQDGNNLNQRITITDAMSRDISRLSPDSALFGIKKGEIYTLRDLLYGLLFVSGNDAAIAIADVVGGNLQHFVDEMNLKAQQLGMYDTHFMNPHGLLETGQYSCAHDLAILGQYAMGVPALHQISGQMAYHIPRGGNHPERFLVNENQFLWWYPGVDGGKTGYDGQSDYIQVMSVTRNHHHLIGVVMQTNNWWTDMRDLMNWGFDSFTWISPRDVDAQHAIPYDYLWNFFAKDTKENTVPTADKGRYYQYTGYSISGPIMVYFDTHGGLKTFGFPIKMMTVSAASLISQQFEHSTIQCNLSTNQCQ